MGSRFLGLRLSALTFHSFSRLNNAPQAASRTATKYTSGQQAKTRVLQAPITPLERLQPTHRAGPVDQVDMRQLLPAKKTITLRELRNRGPQAREQIKAFEDGPRQQVLPGGSAVSSLQVAEGLSSRRTHANATATHSSQSRHASPGDAHLRALDKSVEQTATARTLRAKSIQPVEPAKPPLNASAALNKQPKLTAKSGQPGETVQLSLDEPLSEVPRKTPRRRPTKSKAKASGLIREGLVALPDKPVRSAADKGLQKKPGIDMPKDRQGQSATDSSEGFVETSKDGRVLQGDNHSVNLEPKVTRRAPKSRPQTLQTRTSGSVESTPSGKGLENHVNVRMFHERGPSDGVITKKDFVQAKASEQVLNEVKDEVTSKSPSRRRAAKPVKETELSKQRPSEVNPLEPLTEKGPVEQGSAEVPSEVTSEASPVSAPTRRRAVKKAVVKANELPNNVGLEMGALKPQAEDELQVPETSRVKPPTRRKAAPKKALAPASVVQESLQKNEADRAKESAREWPASESPQSVEVKRRRSKAPLVDAEAEQRGREGHEAYKALSPEEDCLLVVESLEEAKRIAGMLTGPYRNHVYACDTEVMNIDIRKEGPVGHGKMTCLTLYCGKDIDFGDNKRQLFVDLLRGGDEILVPFKDFFEDPTIKKVFHNYGFDRHIFYNHGIDVKGFYADTMHMARLWDSARKTKGGYSLESLSGDQKVMNGHQDIWDSEVELVGKTSMKELFARLKEKKNGESGKVKVLPPIEELQTSERDREAFLKYAARDATATWQLWYSLKRKLEHTEWKGQVPETSGNMWQFYEKYYQPFGELLTDMERAGLLVDIQHLAKMEKVALAEQERAIDKFRKWASKRCPDAKYMNVGSEQQIRQLLYGGVQNVRDEKQFLPIEKEFKCPNTDGFIEEGAKKPKKMRTFTLRGLGANLPVEIVTPSGWPAISGQVLRSLAGKAALESLGLEDEDDEENLENSNSSDSESVDSSAKLAGVLSIEHLPKIERNPLPDTSKYGWAFEAFGGGWGGIFACRAIASLCEVSSISTLLTGFIQPLQGEQMLGPDKRVHCSLNINTETGRLSARRPNLQNQPALEKDRYKIRKAYIAPPGKTLIVADYGQLELRLLAHMASCTSMLEAFKAGGDFHSRTAMNMYEHIRKAVEEGSVILEKGEAKGRDVPLLKDKFGSERRKAKMLNFSIAYGKTAHGLAKDWKVSKKEAQDTVDLWYADRPEVRDWQVAQIEHAKRTQRVSTLLGRTRHLPGIRHRDQAIVSHNERAAINTPVQGSAADIAMLAMLELDKSKRLRETGWRLLLQVHDEVILEGPEESADEALALVVHVMSHPFNGTNVLNVDLAVDARYATSWYDAK